MKSKARSVLLFFGALLLLGLTVEYGVLAYLASRLVPGITLSGLLEGYFRALCSPWGVVAVLLLGGGLTLAGKPNQERLKRGE